MGLLFFLAIKYKIGKIVGIPGSARNCLEVGSQYISCVYSPTNEHFLLVYAYS